jgi:anti-sigma factor RsiW
MELMHRYLDHDLDELEQQELILHLQECTDCAELFERLKQLSDELATLPKVTPAFSLVDAILPRLDEIDRQTAAKEGTAAKETAGPINRRSIPWTRRLRDQISWKLFGGVLAAGIVLGIFVMNEKHLVLIPSAGMKNSDPSTSSREMAASGRSADRVDTRSAAEPKKDLAANDGAKSLGAAPQINDAAKEVDSRQQSAKSGEPSRPNSTISGSSRSDAVSGTDQHKVSSPSGENGFGSGSDSAAGSADNAPDSKSDESAQTFAGPKQKNGGTGTSDQRFTTMLAPQDHNMMSPDGKLTAVIDALKVVVRNTETNESVFTSTYTWQDTDVITFLSWSADNKLTYQVKSGETIQTFVIDINAKTETKAADTGEGRTSETKK